MFAAMGKPIDLLPKLLAAGINTAADVRAEIAACRAAMKLAKGFAKVRAMRRLLALEILGVLK